MSILTKEKQRKSILVSEACFENFNEVRNKLNKNSSDTLTELMNKEIVHTETTIIQRGKMNQRIENIGDFDNCVKQLNKKNED